MRRTWFIAFVICISHIVIADDIKDKVKPPENSKTRAMTIDPETSVFGVPFGTSEDDFIKTFGKPDGYIRFKEGKSGMLYGKTVVFLFNTKGLSGVHIAFDVLDGGIGYRMCPNARFDDFKWRLSNGIQEGTPLPDIMHILGKPRPYNQYQVSYSTGKSVVFIQIAQYPALGEGDEAYVAHGITVENK